MAHKLQPRPRNPYTQTFYTTGQVSQPVHLPRFGSHIAEPGEAATVLARNPHHSQPLAVKPEATFTPIVPYTRGFYTNRGDLKDPKNQLPTVAAAKLMQAKEFAK